MRRPRSHRDSGASAVEFALMLPILLMLVMGVIDFGRIFSFQITLNNAVSEGGLYAAQYPGDGDQVRTRTVEAGDDIGLTTSDVVVRCSGDEIEVSATTTVDMLTFVGQWFGSTRTLDAVSTALNAMSTPCDPSP